MAFTLWIPDTQVTLLVILLAVEFILSLLGR